MGGHVPCQLTFQMEGLTTSVTAEWVCVFPKMMFQVILMRTCMATQITKQTLLFNMNFLVFSQALDSSKFIWTHITRISI